MDTTDPTDPTAAVPDEPDEPDQPDEPDASSSADEPSLLDRARGTGVGLEDDTIVGDDEPRIVRDPDPEADPGAVT